MLLRRISDHHTQVWVAGKRCKAADCRCQLCALLREVPDAIPMLNRVALSAKPTLSLLEFTEGSSTDD